VRGLKRIAIVGFGTAGLRAALSAKSQDSSVSVTVVSEEPYLTYSRCGLPFVIGGQIESFEKLVVASRNMLLKLGVELMLGFRAVDAIGDTLYVEKVDGGESKQIKFDSLIVATGSRASLPPIRNLNVNNVFTLRGIDDGIKIVNALEKVRHFVVVGAGAIGLECAEAFLRRGIKVHVVELMPKVLPSILDDDMASILHESIVKHNVTLKLSGRVSEVLGSNTVEGVVVNDEVIDCDAILVSTGVKANVDFAKKIGLEIGSYAIKTNEFQETSKAGVYSAGDCAETKHLITLKPFAPYLGTVAYRQGNIAGTNAAGGSMRFNGALGSIVLKIFDYEVGATGLNVEQAEREGMKVIVGKAKWYTKAEYYPSHGDLTVKVVFDANNGRLIGGQIIGVSDVAQRINLLSALISMGATVDNIVNLDTCYSPPVADVIEPVVRASEIALKKFRR